jgi:hypothetical protein
MVPKTNLTFFLITVHRQFISGGEFRFLSDINTMPTNLFGLVRPPTLRCVRPNRPHQLAGNVKNCSEMFQLAAGDRSSIANYHIIK